jgi:hypothetical protein
MELIGTPKIQTPPPPNIKGHLAGPFPFWRCHVDELRPQGGRKKAVNEEMVPVIAL